MSIYKDKLETKLIHASSNPDIEQKTGAVNVPIYLSSTFHQASFDDFGPFDYSRSGNPTREALEQKITELEGGVRGLAFASGMAAISSAFMLLSAGDHVVISEDVYGGTYRFVTKVLTQFKIDHTFVNMTDLNAISNAIQPNTKVIYIETPSNPCLNITDIEAVVEIAKEHNCLTFLDNTFMTPLCQNPLQLGVDVVLHSATKFLSGHSDIIAGLAITKNEELGKRLAFIQNSFGAILGAQDSYLLIQGMKTLGTRLKQSSESAQHIATYLHHHQLIEEVYYPGLSFHPGHDIHVKQSHGFGAVLSFRLPNKEIAKAFIEHVRIPVFAVSLGAVESILSYPATMSHAAMSKEEREKRGITDGLLRLSVGLEHVDDLIADFEQALQAASQKAKAQSL
ncbi:cystathionine beta-lyase [Schinkia azotoformans]|uniref:cysteine-S-conjugate beta-lyase n=1 Tax=Schinkia azotoformans LMG 9581 TaxID=1131731 RepID=K6CSQ2_SCHAZ|nr:cystathionine beta-lyase [Schinkia azotoformans]EKN63272.1 cystathionine beta-lyase [Schinkia azotoformans LMG 9581]MEC1637179.1 cystathionine beta-lyase [Schinkia azotoformans]MEC1720626.1 cystathionine beta-lyase [Schinkia azotoformans]MEC1943583.1 cystathionine beta-lyase [Schinkia azotoformans]MED4354904.1 cystathionine beta-lyase [Schinkia azotoformans]